MKKSTATLLRKGVFVPGRSHSRTPFSITTNSRLIRTGAGNWLCRPLGTSLTTGVQSTDIAGGQATQSASPYAWKCPRLCSWRSTRPTTSAAATFHIAMPAVAARTNVCCLEASEGRLPTASRTPAKKRITPRTGVGKARRSSSIEPLNRKRRTVEPAACNQRDAECEEDPERVHLQDTDTSSISSLFCSNAPGPSVIY